MRTATAAAAVLLALTLSACGHDEPSTPAEAFRADMQQKYPEQFEDLSVSRLAELDRMGAAVCDSLAEGVPSWYLVETTVESADSGVTRDEVTYTVASATTYLCPEYLP